MNDFMARRLRLSDHQLVELPPSPSPRGLLSHCMASCSGLAKVGEPGTMLLACHTLEVTLAMVLGF